MPENAMTNSEEQEPGGEAAVEPRAGGPPGSYDETLDSVFSPDADDATHSPGGDEAAAGQAGAGAGQAAGSQAGDGGGEGASEKTPKPSGEGESVAIQVRGQMHRVPAALAPLFLAMQEDHQAAVGKIHELSGGKRPAGDAPGETPEARAAREEKFVQELDGQIFEALDDPKAKGKGITRTILRIVQSVVGQDLKAALEAARDLRERQEALERNVTHSLGDTILDRNVAAMLAEDLEAAGLPADVLSAGDVAAEFRKLQAGKPLYASGEPMEPRDIYYRAKDRVMARRLASPSATSPAPGSSAPAGVAGNGADNPLARRAAPAPNRATPQTLGRDTADAPAPLKVVHRSGPVSEDDY